MHGVVVYDYEIGRHRVGNGEYAAFLNAVAGKSDPHGLHHPRMRIDRRGIAGAYTYTAHPATALDAVTYVSWHDALRYCNWLHGGDSERGAYSFTGETSSGARRPGAKVFLPTEDEWVKVVYYDIELKNYEVFVASHSEMSCPPTDIPRSPNGMLGIEDRIWEWTESRVGELFRGLRSDSWF